MAPTPRGGNLTSSPPAAGLRFYASVDAAFGTTSPAGSTQVYNQFWRCVRNGTLTVLVRKVRVIAEMIDELDREVSVDSSIVRALQYAASARRPGSHTGGERVLVRADRAR